MLENILNRGVEEIIDRSSLEHKLKSGKKLRVKLGIDPTSPDLHLGRSIPLLKLQDFQKQGHTVVFIVGDFTGVIGDTSDKESERPIIDKDTIKQNLKTYVEQASKIIDIKSAEIYYNSEWLSKLGYEEIGKQADIFSVSDFIARENINKRLKEGRRVSLREVLYPLMQGYDSVMVKSDVEVGGTDQRFNLLAGRDMQKLYNLQSQDIVMGPLIEGTDGRKMSSSFGNTIKFTDSPTDMYGKVMGIRDDLIIKYFNLLTRIDIDTIYKYNKELEQGINPRDIKMKLAKELVRMYHSDLDSQKAEDYFVNTFSLHNLPEEIGSISPVSYFVMDLLIEIGFASSKSEARRLIEQGGVKVDGQVVNDTNLVVGKGSIVQKGKLRVIKVA